MTVKHEVRLLSSMNFNDGLFSPTDATAPESSILAAGMAVDMKHFDYFPPDFMQPLSRNASSSSLSSFDSAPSRKRSRDKSESDVTPRMCGYRTGKCPNMQAVKRNGKLHKLCEFHREKANFNQKKLDRKKRLMRSSPESELDHHSSVDDSAVKNKTRKTVKSRSVKHEAQGETSRAPDFTPTKLEEAPLGLAHDELAIFCTLMETPADAQTRNSSLRATIV